MFGITLIVFRESLEAALFIGIMAAATRGLALRGRYLAIGVLSGLFGAVLLATSAQYLSNLADGVGQDLVNAGILSVALLMLIWHCVWVSNRGQQAALEARELAMTFTSGQKAPWALTTAVALSVLREGAETVLFVSGYASGAHQHSDAIFGTLLGLLGGCVVGGIIYFGLVRVPLKRMFTITNVMILLLAASIASQLARALSQAGLVEWWSSPLWNTSALLSTDSPAGTFLHALVGYDAQPTGLQLGFYLLTVTVIVWGTHVVRQAQLRR
jgi:high-affinity iron transporter